MNEKCNSCGKRMANDPEGVSFPCPNCGNQTICRCSHCKKLSTQYVCPECGFEGPN
ncbi:DUF1610 domain-containing protein [Candidatus Woesearchaeota archaeon]|nr:DUF1610 domain-containing protein [Candidatus Woesearchaeota archaeon]